VLWREATVQERNINSSEPATVSVIIPAINEAEALPTTIDHLRKNSSILEIIVVDGGSTDRTPEIAEQLGCRVLASKPGRGGQMRAGAAAAKGDVILLLHADTWLPPQATSAMLNCLRDRSVVAGGFWKEFRDSPLLLLGSKWKCAVRLWIGRRIAGDQGMFIRRDVLERIGGIPDMALMEEFALSSRLRREGRLALADAIALTSARRFQKLGVIRTYLRMWVVTMRYRMGASPNELRKQYEKQ
jgi:rSAM/selenodomain-associated transferase 2